MKRTAALGFLLSIAGGTLVAQEATVRSLVSKDIAGVPGRELSMITVEYPPGGFDPVHTHNAQAVVYVLEGSIVMAPAKFLVVLLKDKGAPILVPAK